MITWISLLKYGVSELESAAVDDAAFEATQLILTFFDYSYESFIMRRDESADDASAVQYKKFLQRRIAGEPLQYILGRWDFYKSTFLVGEGVLIPRPETEELVEECVSIIRKYGFTTVYDLCTGSGCIGISIAKECPWVHCYLFELYDEAFLYAEKNIAKENLPNVTLIRHNVLEEFSAEIPDAELIVSNPPYIESGELPTLQAEVLREPHTALDGGVDGLIFYKAFFVKWAHKLKLNGYFAFECAENQTERIASLAGDGYKSQTASDIYNNNRFVYCQKIN